MHSLRKYQGFIIYQTWADIESFGTDKSGPYEGLIKKSTIYLKYLASCSSCLPLLEYTNPEAGCQSKKKLRNK